MLSTWENMKLFQEKMNDSDRMNMASLFCA
jgi:hypothetical protein